MVNKEETAFKKKRIRCLHCSNFMTVRVYEDGSSSGKCPVCKSLIFSKQHSPKEEHYRVVLNN